MDYNDAFLGTGWSFPPEFNKGSKLVLMRSGAEDIKESLAVIITTRLGERIMEPKFGCNLEEVLFKPLDLTMKTYASDLIRSAILYFEPRINLNSVDLSKSDDLNGVLYIELDYTIRSTNSRMNMVYPYYRSEGTSL
ncbi:MAG: GPW/gp25 family protein [Flavobacteriales bacterium]|jgi:phage baseplate assembly protein W|nr:GPW/gp25 family protein [Flavobacteriales bacterium]